LKNYAGPVERFHDPDNTADQYNRMISTRVITQVMYQIGVVNAGNNFRKKSDPITKMVYPAQVYRQYVEQHGWFFREIRMYRMTKSIGFNMPKG
jgi:hypothetical protein